VNFDFSSEQQMLRDQARRFLDEASSRAQVRRWLDENQTATAALWPQLAEMGWLGAAVTEDLGGLGLGALELCVLAEEFGRALTPVPFFATACVAADLLSRCPANDTRNALLSGIADGSRVTVLANGLAPTLQKLPSAIDDKVRGLCGTVEHLAEAHTALVAAQALDGSTKLVAVDLASAGVTRTELEGFDTLRPHWLLELADAACTTLAEGDAADQLLATVRLRAAAYQAFEQIGTAEAALKLARDYALQRYAFGRPIAGNQAVKHRLADMYVKIELARCNAYHAAWALTAGEHDLARAAAAARLSASEALVFAAEECLHLHGGIGYTWEADCHLFLRRARLLNVSLGSSASWSRQLVAASHFPAAESANA
jgi:acyl-CoA dehydrogenase